MGSLAAYVGDAPDQVAGELALHAQVPLLHVRPNRVSGNGSNIRGKSNRARIGAIRSDTFVAACEVLDYIEHSRGNAWCISHRIRRRGATFQRTSICFVAGAVFEEYSVSGTYRSFSVALGIPSEANSRAGIE